MKDQNVETIHLPISTNYVRHWGFWEAVRELIQNKVDTKSGWVDYLKGDSLSIRTSSGKLDRSTLLLGESSKRDDEDTIGAYGEGYKLAFLVLTRLGHVVTVHNYDEVWNVSIEIHPQLGIDCLTVSIEKLEQSLESVEITISGVDYYQVDEVLEKYLHTPSDFKSHSSQFIYNVFAEYGGSQILEIEEDFEDDEDYSKKLFVGGLYVCDLGEDFKYSYNFAPNILELDRDRSSVSDFYLGLEVVRLLVRSNNIEKLIKMVSDKDPDVGTYGSVYAEDDSGVKGKTVGDLTEEQFYSTFGENAYPINSSFNSAKISALTEMCMELGLKPVTVSNLYYQMLPESVKELPEMPKALDGKASSALDKFLKEHWKLLKSQSKRRLEKLITSYKIGGC